MEFYVLNKYSIPLLEFITLRCINCSKLLTSPHRIYFVLLDRDIFYTEAFVADYELGEFRFF